MKDYATLIKAELDAAQALDDLESPTAEDMEKMQSHMDMVETLKAEKNVAEENSKRLQAQFNEMKKAEPRKAKPQATVEVSAPEFTKDPNKGYSKPREFFMDVMNHAKSGTSNEKLDFLAAVGSDEQQTQSDSLGGFLVPEGFMPDMLSVGIDIDPTVGRTTNIPMSTPSISIPVRADKNKSSSVAGGVVAYRKTETQAIQDSKMSFEQVKLQVHTLSGLSYTTDELIQDSPISVAAILETGFREAFSDKMLREKMNGTGAGQYEGIMNSGALIEVAKESGQTADTINITNLAKMRARSWGYQDAIWMANYDTMGQFIKLNDSSNNIYMPSMQDDVPDRLLGRPLVFTDYCQTLGDAGDIVLANWSQYLEGTYQPLTTAESMHVRFVYNESAFKFNMRNDGRSWWRNALTPQISSVTRSPWVTLAERA